MRRAKRTHDCEKLRLPALSAETLFYGHYIFDPRDCYENRMPHITIEYSANVELHHDVDALLAVVHDAALAHGLPPADGLRTRAARRDHYRVADGSDDLGFVAIAIRIGPGRDPATKTSFIETLLDAAEAELAHQSTELAIAWSIELNEIDPDFRINRNHVRTRLASRASTAQETTSNG